MMSSNRDAAERMREIREWVCRGSGSELAHHTPVGLSPLTDLSRLRDRVADVHSKQVLSEQPFTSSVPVLGRLIVWLRSAWNWVATKWYVVPLLQQQNEFNDRVAQSWDEMLRYLDRVIVFSSGVYRRLDRLEERLDEIVSTSATSNERQMAPSPTADVAGVVEAVVLDGAQFDSGPIAVLSCGQGEAVRILSEHGLDVYGVESDLGLVQQAVRGNLSVVRAGDVEHLASLPDDSLGGVLAVWSGPVSVQDAARLLRECRRVLYAGACVVWVWPWPAELDETDAQMVRSIALGLGFGSVRLEATQHVDGAFQALSMRE